MFSLSMSVEAMEPSGHLRLGIKQEFFPLRSNRKSVCEDLVHAKCSVPPAFAASGQRLPARNVILRLLKVCKHDFAVCGTPPK